MKKNSIIDWLKESNRWKHLVGGFVLGLFLTFFCALGAAGGMEFKDVQWGGRWDWTDFLLTCLGGLVGGVINALVLWELLHT